MHYDFSELVADLLLNKKSKGMDLFAYIAWLAWVERNNQWHGKNACTHPEEVVSKATRLLEEFKQVNKRGEKGKIARSGRWSPPPVGFYKLNTDGAVDVVNGKRGLGAVLRNEYGDLMGACAFPIFGNFSPLVTELLALKAGLQFALDTRTLPILVETDCSEAVRLVNSTDHCWAEEGVLIADVKALMYDVGVSTISFQPRECNSTAHCIAKFALTEQSAFTCIEDGPDWLMESINNDSKVCNTLNHQ